MYIYVSYIIIPTKWFLQLLTDIILVFKHISYYIHIRTQLIVYELIE